MMLDGLDIADRCHVVALAISPARQAHAGQLRRE
jgi:hypothetical protein